MDSLALQVFVFVSTSCAAPRASSFQCSHTGSKLGRTERRAVPEAVLLPGHAPLLGSESDVGWALSCLVACQGFEIDAGCLLSYLMVHVCTVSCSAANCWITGLLGLLIDFLPWGDDQWHPKRHWDTDLSFMVSCDFWEAFHSSDCWCSESVVQILCKLGEKKSEGEKLKYRIVLGAKNRYWTAGLFSCRWCFLTITYGVSRMVHWIMALALQAWPPEFNSQNPQSCPLTFTCVP